MFVVADQQLLALRKLSQGSFHYPVTWLVTTWQALLPTILTNGPDEGHTAVVLCHLVPDRIVEGTVQSQFSSCTVTSGRLTTKASIVASSSFISKTRILAIIILNKLPSPTTKGDCVVPFLPRSVGGLPVFLPSNQASPGRPSDACHRQFTNPEFDAFIDQGPADLLKDAVAALLMGGKLWWTRLSTTKCLGSLFHWHLERSRKMMPSIANCQSIRERSLWVVGFAGAFYRWIGSNPLPEFVVDFPNYVQGPCWVRPIGASHCA